MLRPLIPGQPVPVQFVSDFSALVSFLILTQSSLHPSSLHPTLVLPFWHHTFHLNIVCTSSLSGPGRVHVSLLLRNLDQTSSFCSVSLTPFLQFQCPKVIKQLNDISLWCGSCSWNVVLCCKENNRHCEVLSTARGIKYLGIKWSVFPITAVRKKST